MFKNRLVKLLVVLAIVALGLLMVGTVISAQPVPEVVGMNRTAPLDWYLAHDHAVLDGDNNVIGIRETNRMNSQWAPLDWYLTHDHAILDGDANILSR